MTTEDVIAIFPLPDLVHFPKIHLPLHIFEERYCRMVQDTIENKQLIGMFLLKPGWEEDYYGNPPIYPVGCAGEMVHVENLADGKYNIVLKGLYRARALEVVQEHPYRTTRVEALPDTMSLKRTGLQRLTVQLRDDFEKLVTLIKGTGIERLGNADFSELVNTIAMSLQLEIEEKQSLLEENDVVVRARHLHEVILNQLHLVDLSRRFIHLKPIDPNLN
jgi:hypothetical protein